jgi:hypothetical protein
MKKIVVAGLVLVVVPIAIIAVTTYNVVKLPLSLIPHPITPTVTIQSGPIILEAIQNQAKLETVSMLLVNDQDVSRVWGVAGACRESITYLGYYTVTAGVDLHQITADDITVENDGNPASASVSIKVPAASILHVEPDMQQSRIVHQEASLLSSVCGTKLPEMMFDAQKKIEEYAQSAALEKGILSMAQKQAGLELKQLLLNIGYPNVQTQY